MGTSIDILFLDSPTLGQPGTLEQIIQLFQDLDFELENFLVDDDPEMLFENRARLESLSVQEIIEESYQTQSLIFDASHPEQGVVLLQQIGWGEHDVDLKDRVFVNTSTLSIDIHHPEIDSESFNSFILEIAERFYSVLKPSFGWIDYELLDGWRIPTYASIGALELQCLFWANFLGPKFVRKLGREKILNAPAWKVSDLDDGGLLYRLGSHLTGSGDHVDLGEVLEYWGVESVR